MSSGGSRANSTLTGYAIVLGAIVLLVAVMAFVVDARRQEYLPSVDYTADAATLGEVAPYRPYAPEGLPEGWTATSSRLEGGGAAADGETGEPVRWTVGFVTPTDRHAAFHISDADPEEFVVETSLNGEPDGTATVDGRSWQRRFNAAEDERSLVWRADDATLVVSGGASYTELATLAGALKPREATP